MYKSILVAAVAASFAFAPAAFAEKRSQAQIEHDEFCAKLKESYDYVLAYWKANPTKRRKYLDSAHNMKLLGEQNRCKWAGPGAF